jgi:hypothetical protein
MVQHMCHAWVMTIPLPSCFPTREEKLKAYVASQESFDWDIVSLLTDSEEWIWWLMAIAHQMSKLSWDRIRHPPPPPRQTFLCGLLLFFSNTLYGPWPPRGVKGKNYKKGFMSTTKKRSVQKGSSDSFGCKIVS